MWLFGGLLSAVLLAVVLSSCNTTEALTPQVNVGGGTRPSSPVTQADTDRMARSQHPETYNNSRNGYRTNPQNTLEAQAQAMQSGSGSPASSGPPPQWNGQRNVQDQQQPMQAASSPQYQPPPPISSPQQSTSPPSASAASSGSIRFLPIIGAPVQAVTPLSRQLGAQARAAGLTIRPSTDAGTEHILKGYFSAFADDGKVTVIYVWDILDGAGSRLHRMQGQEIVPARGSDPWAAVPANVMEGIAAKTIQDYMGWRQSHG